MALFPLADSWGMHGDGGPGWWILMMVFMVLFWGAIVFGVVWLVRGGLTGRARHRRQSPIEVLERRFAEGTISVEEYRMRRAVLVDGTGEKLGRELEGAT